MSDEELKHILIDVSDSVSEVLDDVLSELHIEVYADELARDDFDIIFTENVSYPAEDGVQVIVISNEEYNGPFLVISKEHLSSPVVQKAIRRYLGEKTSLQLEGIDSVIEMKSYKITNKFSRGYYYDLVSSLASENNFLFDVISENFLKVVNSIFNDFKSLPIEFEVVISDSFYAIQIHFGQEKFSSKKVEQIGRTVNGCFFDGYYLEEAKTTVVGLYFDKECSGKSVLVSETPIVSSGHYESDVYNKLAQITDYKIIEAPGSVKKTSTLSKVKKVIDFIKKTEFQDDYSFEQKLSMFPDQDIIEALGQDDLDFIRAVISDGKVYEAISASILGHTEDLFKNDDFPEKIAGALEEMEFYEFSSFFDSEEDAIKRISGVTEDLTEETTLVSGRIDEDESNQIVKGSREDLTPENFLVKGSRENLSKEKWRVKRLEIATKVKEELKNIAESGVFDSEIIKDRVKSTIREGLMLSENEDNITTSLNNSVINGASTKSIESEISTDRSADEIFLKLENDRYKGQINKKNDQIIRMKRIIDSMKSDFVANKKAEKSLKDSLSSGEDVSAEQRLKAAALQVEALMREVKNKEVLVEQMERAHAHTLKNRDHRISLLEEKLADSAEAASAVTSIEFEAKSRIKELELKNKQFENQLNVAESRIKSLSKKYDDEMKNRVQVEMNGSGMTKLLEDEKRRVVQLLEKIAALEGEASSSKESDIAIELDSSKEKIRELETHLKESQIESKKYEQKMKFMTSQMTELEKKLKKAAGRTGGSSAGGVNDKRLKQLEGNMEKINVLKAKAEEELAKKREEAHRYKQENGILNNKIDELERKLAKYEKNVA
ncbi:hypothetical protein [Bacteriovorax sp. Seq25_V]|uniref:hypothetical protein n=1 Tax=Bacteriovorax sp. Seq25_V TaxID=1201288 RepID=UPI00038A1037|nr:hypothetical protein [Bacteriovorax sp. Seq25_V]EQC47419.1 hypothetical protein M900_0582 [Bacteriovorax sp. Seq25_V]